jgi:hypothetical protein
MTVYAVGSDWEHNMRDDSDWFQCGYDTETGKITRYEIGSTRYPGGVKNLPDPPEELLPTIKECLYRMWCSHVAAAHYRAVNSPTETTVVGRRVELKEKCYNRPRIMEPCRKCGATGKWANPKRPTDVRKCFACDGSGTFTGASLKGEMVERPAGLQGEAIRCDVQKSMYGTWVRSKTVKILLDNGERINAPLEKVRLVVPDPRPEDVARIARRHADELDAYSLFPTSAYSFMSGCLLMVG